MGAWLPHFPFSLCLYILFTQESRVMELQTLQCDHQGLLSWRIISYWLISKRGWRDLEWLVTEIYTDYLEWDEHRVRRHWVAWERPKEMRGERAEEQISEKQWAQMRKVKGTLQAQNNSDELVFIKEKIF